MSDWTDEMDFTMAKVRVKTLEQQLAEKDKEIERLRGALVDINKGHLQEPDFERYAKRVASFALQGKSE